MFDVTITQVLNATEALGVLRTKSIPARAAFRVARVVQEISEIKQHFDEAVRDLVDRYAQKDENGEYVRSEDNMAIMLIPGKVDEYNKEIADLQAQTITLDGDKILSEDLDAVELDVNTAIALMPFVEEKK